MYNDFIKSISGILNRRKLFFLTCFTGTLEQFVYGGQNPKYSNEEIESEDEEEQSDMELFRDIKRRKFIDINEWTNLLDILDKADENMEFPFILFIAVNLTDYNNTDLDYEQISKDINKKMTSLVYKQDNKLGRRVLVVVCPISTTIEWKDYFLSQFIDIPTGFPLFILTCRIKNCTFCKRRSTVRRIMTYCGISIPLEQWYQSLYYKNDLFNIKKTSIPYGENKIGIMTAILNHGFRNEGDIENEDDE